MSATVKTGRTRHRVYKPLFGAAVLVLQVEERRQGWAIDDWGDKDWVDWIGWRDAKPEDITTEYTK